MQQYYQLNNRASCSKATQHALGRLVGCALLCAAWGNAWAGPPFFTDDPEPVEFRHWEFYFASQYLDAKGGSSGTAPHFEVNYGAYPNLQLHMIAPLAFSHPSGGATSYGPGDVEVGVKYRFIGETQARPQVGTFVLAEAPSGDSDRNLGQGKAQLFFPLFMQKSWGPWTTYGGGGYWLNPGEDNKNWVYLGWLLQRDLSRYVTLGAEVFHRTPDSVAGESGTGFTGGGQINFTKHCHLLFSSGRDFSGPNRLTGYVALQWTS